MTSTLEPKHFSE